MYLIPDVLVQNAQFWNVVSHRFIWRYVGQSFACLRVAQLLCSPPHSFSYIQPVPQYTDTSLTMPANRAYIPVATPRAFNAFKIKNTSNCSRGISIAIKLMVSSTGQRKGCIEPIRGRCITKCFSWARIQLQGHLVEIVLAEG